MSTPSSESTSAYADFAFKSSALPHTSTFLYSLDGSTYSGCSSTLQVGPLASGAHSLSVCTLRDANAFSSAVVSDPITFVWHIISLSNSTVALDYLTDGQHTLRVVATDSLGHVEASPRTVGWAVDTIPPSTLGSLLSSPYSNAPSATANVTCVGEEYSTLCTYCWRLRVNGSAALIGPTTCTANRTLVVPAPSDGLMELLVAAVDWAGNVGKHFGSGPSCVVVRVVLC